MQSYWGGGEYIVFQTKKVYERTDHPKKEKKKNPTI